MAAIEWTQAAREKVRLLAGLEATVIDNQQLDILYNMAVDWFQENSGTTFVLGEDTSYDNSVAYYCCYLGSIVANGVGIERIIMGDVQVYYDNAQFKYFVELALELLAFKLGISIKRTTYNADPWLGTVNWNKNITGVDSTKNFRKRPRGL
tara:strand:+ start:933 stop:1385 length:453 start_codon:yes stop_codon:yes gene_type:complete